MELFCYSSRIGRYYEGYWIGELNLFTAQTRNHTVISVTFSELLEITQTSFQQTLKDFPNMLQTFQELKLKIKNGDTSSVRTFDFQSFP